MLPKYVVLNTEGIMRMFRDHGQQFMKPATLPDDLVQELLLCMDNKFSADRRVDEMTGSMLDQTFEYDYDRGLMYDYNNFVDENIIGFLIGLAAVVFQQLENMNAYDGWGTLMYEYYLPEKDDVNVIILRLKHGISKNMELPRFDAVQFPGHFELARSSY